MFNLLPNTRLLVIFAVLIAGYIALGAVEFFTQSDLSPWLWALAIGVLGIAVADALWALFINRRQRIHITRDMPQHFIVGQHTDIALNLHAENLSARQTLTLSLFDHLPQTFELSKNAHADKETMPISLTLNAGEYAEIHYKVKPLRRGEATFTGTQIRLNSALGLWQVNRFITVSDRVKTYPDFRRLDDNSLLSDNNQSHGTLPHHRKRGSGTDFAELREYQLGDSLNHIDHKATSRLNKLMAKSFQIERDQQVMILLDCSRRLRVFQRDLSHFDYALNSTILLARTILNQGDAVGLMSFGSETLRYTQPRKGRNSVNRLLNQVYDLEPSRNAPDYVGAAKQLMARQKRRSLVVVVTSLQAQDTDDIKTMLRILQKRHLVLIVNLKEELLGEEITVRDFDDAVYYASRETYRNYRQQMIQQISNHQLVLLDTYPTNLTAKLINLYLNIKQSGRF